MISALSWLLAASAASLPMYFEANVGQAPAEVLARGQSGALRLEALRSGLRLRGGDDTVLVRFDRPGEPKIRFEGRLGARVQQVGPKGTFDIPTYQRVVLEKVWPGIDVVLLERDGRFAFDLIVEPGADPARAGFLLEGDAAIVDSGALVAKDPRGVLALGRPLAFQGTRGVPGEIAVAFEVRGQRASFRVGPYDRTRPLVIDPVVEYASYVPEPSTVQMTSSGPFLYLASALPASPTVADPELYLAKIDPRLSGAASLVWATSLNGNNPTAGPSGQLFLTDMDVNAAGRILVCGSQGGGGARGQPFSDTDDANAAMPRIGVGFGVVVSVDGTTIEHVSSFGDSGTSACAFASTGSSFYLTGRSDIGTPFGSMIPNMTGWGFLVQINADDDPQLAGDDDLFATRLGINSTLGSRISVDPSGNVTLLLNTSNQSGPDVDAWVNASSFQTRNDEVAICKFATALGANALLGCTYLGGTGQEGSSAITTDAQGRVYALVHNGSTDYPRQPNGPTPIQSGLTVTRLSANLGSLDFSYFLPSNIFSIARDIFLLDDGSIAVVDGSGGGTPPLTTCAISTDNVGTNFAVIDAAGTSVLFGTRLPGLTGSTGAALPGGRVAVAGSIFTHPSFAAYVNGYGTAQRSSGLVAFSTRETCVDVALTGMASTNLPTRGDVVHFTLEATNEGEGDAAGVAVSLLVPAQLQIVDVTTTLGTCTATVPGSARCTVGDLALTATAAIELTAIATATGAGTGSGEVSTTDIDLDPSNNQVSFGVSVGPPAGPCGAVSIYGECAGDTLRICENRNTGTEALVVTDCAAAGQVCRAARGLVAAHCEDAGAADAGTPDDSGQVPVDAGVPAMADATTPAPDAGMSASDGGVIIGADAGEEKEESGCDCSTTPTARSSTLLLVAFVALAGSLRRRRSLRASCPGGGR